MSCKRSFLFISFCNFLILSLFEHASSQQVFNFCPQYSPACSCPNVITLECSNFERLQELRFDTRIQLLFKYVLISPRRAIALDSPINLANLNLQEKAEISIRNFNSFNIFINPFGFRNLSSRFASLSINNSALYFVNNQNQALSDESICNSLTLGEQSTPLFSSFDRVILFDSVTYPSTRLCPKIFHNSFINEIIFYNIDESARKITYIDLDNFYFMSNTIRISSVYFINGEIDTLDNSILNTNLYRYIRNLNLVNIRLNRIEKNLISSLKQLRSLGLDLINYREFINRLNSLSDSSWLQELNTDLTSVDLTNGLSNQQIENFRASQTELLLGDRRLEYDYPEDDFCLFRKFPHQKLVYPALSTKPFLSCSCTVIWLIQYNKYYFNRNRLNTQSVINCTSNETFLNQSIANCDFPDKLQRCAADVSDPVDDEKRTRNTGSMETSSYYSITCFICYCINNCYRTYYLLLQT